MKKKLMQKRQAELKLPQGGRLTADLYDEIHGIRVDEAVMPLDRA